MNYERSYLKTCTYSVAERMFQEGRITQEDWDWYCHLWRNSAVRFSHVERSEQHITKEAMESCSVCKAEGLTFDPLNKSWD